MIRTVAAFFSTFFLLAAVSVATAQETERTTLFYRILDSWAFGHIKLQNPVRAREGRLLAFPSVLSEVEYAVSPNARNLILVWDVDAERDVLDYKDSFLAPIVLLPEHAYWRENLPVSRRHAVSGGSRYIFKGDDEVEVRRALAPFLASLKAKAPQRWSQEVLGISKALESTNAVVRADALEHMRSYVRLERYFSPEAEAVWRSFLEGDAQDSEKAHLAFAVGRWNIVALKDAMEVLAATKTGAAAAEAFEALRKLGQDFSREELDGLAKAESEPVRAWAFGRLARQAGSDAALLERLLGRLRKDPSLEVRAALAAGLGDAKVGAATQVLVESLESDAPSGPAAAKALAQLGQQAALEKALFEKDETLASNAAMGLAAMPDCSSCIAAIEKKSQGEVSAPLREQLKELIRDKARAAEAARKLTGR